MGATERGLRKRLVLENTRPYGLVCLFWCACGLAGARMVVRSPGTNFRNEWFDGVDMCCLPLPVRSPS